jgi:hypothetical protein
VEDTLLTALANWHTDKPAVQQLSKGFLNSIIDSGSLLEINACLQQ